MYNNQRYILLTWGKINDIQQKQNENENTTKTQNWKRESGFMEIFFQENVIEKSISWNIKMIVRNREDGSL